MLYTFGSSSVRDSFTTVVSVDGLLFALYYALTASRPRRTTASSRRASVWNLIHILVFSLAVAAFLAYIIFRSVGRTWRLAGPDLVSLYVMLGIGVAITLYARFWAGRTTSSCRGGR